MATLFNREISAPSVSSILDSLDGRNIFDKSIEILLVSEIERAIKEIDDIKDDAILSALNIVSFSGDNLHVDYRRIESLPDIGIELDSMTIANDGSIVSGVVGTWNVDEAYGDMFWKKGQYVGLKNVGISSIGVNNIGIMITSESYNRNILSYDSGQVLNSCFTENINGEFDTSNIRKDRVVNIGDCSREFHSAGDTIDINSKHVVLGDISVSSAEINSSNIVLSDSTIRSLKCEGDSLSLFGINSSYCSVGNFMVSDESRLPSSIETNMKTVSSVSLAMKSRCAPVYGWSTSGVKIDTSDRNEVVDEVVRLSLDTSLVLGKRVPVSKKDLYDILDETYGRLESVGTCND